MCYNTLVNKTIIISDKMFRHFLKKHLQADCLSKKEKEGTRMLECHKY
jgi:hypothetical protein